VNLTIATAPHPLVELPVRWEMVCGSQNCCRDSAVIVVVTVWNEKAITLMALMGRNSTAFGQRAKKNAHAPGLMLHVTSPVSRFVAHQYGSAKFVLIANWQQ
jgi:hypothetical protein